MASDALKSCGGRAPGILPDAIYDVYERREIYLHYPFSTVGIRASTMADVMDTNSARSLDDLVKEPDDMKAEDIRSSSTCETFVKTSDITAKNGDPLAYGAYLYFRELNDKTGDDGDEIMRILVNRLGHRELVAPYIAMDLSYAEALNLAKDDGTLIVDADKKNRKAIKICMQAKDIADITHFATKGNSRVYVHREVPVYRWFHAINIQLRDKNIALRAMPFPIENTMSETSHQGTIFYQILPVTVQEYNLYEQVLHANLHNGGNLVDPEEAFALTAKMSYQILSNRGIKEMTHEQVDSYLVHVLISKQSSMHGVFIHEWNDEDFETATKWNIFT